jgi:putative ABC transport system ATP-binding protein
VALAGVDLALHRGESVAVMGPSGSGKSTLLHCLAGITRPDAGTVWLDGRRIDNLGERSRTRLRRGEFGFVFQSGQLLPELPAAENVALPLMLEGQTRRRGVERARRWLASLGLDGLEHRRPGELSGGQAQRVAIARALVADPAVVFADEPTAALDQATGLATVELLVGVTRDAGAALLVVTHDPGVAALCTRTVHIRDGHLVPRPPPIGPRPTGTSAPGSAVEARRPPPAPPVATHPAEATSPPDTATARSTAAPRSRTPGPAVTAATAAGTADQPGDGTRTPGGLPGPQPAATPVGTGNTTTAADLPGTPGRSNRNRRGVPGPAARTATTAGPTGTPAGPARAGAPGPTERRLVAGRSGPAGTATATGGGSTRTRRAQRPLRTNGQTPGGTSWMTMSWGWPT